MTRNDVPHDRDSRSGADGHAARLAQPHLLLLHGCMLLSGFGTVFLGPVLPALTANAHTTDKGSGLFFLAQFIGAFFGGITTSRRLWFSLIRGTAAATLGFLCLGLCTLHGASMPLDVLALAVLGYGAGQMLTSTNLLATKFLAEGRSTMLARINFTWSLGALLSPFLLGNLLTYFRLGSILLCVSLCFAAAFAYAVADSRRGTVQAARDGSVPQDATRLSGTAFGYFALLLFLYGGVETSLSGWLTTFGTRYGAGTLRASSLLVTALWIGITAGRGLTPFLLKTMRDGRLLWMALAAASVLALLLTQVSGALVILGVAVLLGLSLAPWFPLVLAGLLAEGATAGQTGSIIAVSGIGAAFLPWLVGVVSGAAHSLRFALLVPLLALVVLLGCSILRTSSPQQLRGTESV